MIKVLIVDDHPVVGEGTRSLVEQEEDMTAKVIVESEEIVNLMKEEKYDIYLIDLYMPKINGIELTKIILQIEPEAKIIIYTGFDLASHYNLLVEAGVAGFINKTATQEQLITSIRCALREETVISLQLLRQLRRVSGSPTISEDFQTIGELALTNKEQQILDGVSKGATNKAIAINLSMSQRNVEHHLTKIFTKLGVSSRTEALLKAQEFGLLSIHILPAE